MSDESPQPGGPGRRHGAATTIAEQAVQARVRGDADEADRLFAEAARIDPDAVTAVLSEGVVARRGPAAAQDDAEVAAITRTVEPGADAPSRAGIGGPGSGADEQAT